MDKRVYLLREEGSDYYIVGHSNNYQRRISELQTGNPRKLICLCSTIMNDKDDEKKVREALEEYKVNLGGGTKWFVIPEDDIEGACEAIRNINSEDYNVSPFQVKRVYLLREEGSDYYKVGHFKDYEIRISDLQTGNPRKLIYLCSTIMNDKDDEKKVREALKQYKVNLGAGIEWFKIPEGDIEGACEAIRNINSEDYNVSPFQVKRVYLLREEGSDYYKVGHFKDYEIRISDLQTGNPRKLICLCSTIMNDKGDEKKVLEALKQYKGNLDGGTEWFKIPEGDIEGACEAIRNINSEDYNVSPFQVKRVYLLREEGSDYYKVGHFKDYEIRISDLQTGNPRKLICLCSTIMNDKGDEKKVLEALKQYKGNLDGGTEWFKIPDDDIEGACEAIRNINPADYKVDTPLEERNDQEQSHCAGL
ncbi:uncharacterized protein LOC119956285 isoform X2 [Scyliorhinus canicula]|uniref:uncharacterized protein LOC119956285 isoform X1 n=1 Tax=Scyliorhinus canicula TaxID=7830 RepID=UPI0018F69C24|nr:uncharacterized protein LOC119956285 isoform X1 [Scyliorhinus canicula]XP_038639297.1 uncharacterized protein LOC119956285 isoform X2 [Scyliorhinus canicula]